MNLEDRNNQILMELINTPKLLVKFYMKGSIYPEVN